MDAKFLSTTYSLYKVKRPVPAPASRTVENTVVRSAANIPDIDHFNDPVGVILPGAVNSGDDQA